MKLKWSPGLWHKRVDTEDHIAQPAPGTANIQDGSPDLHDESDHLFDILHGFGGKTDHEVEFKGLYADPDQRFSRMENIIFADILVDNGPQPFRPSVRGDSHALQIAFLKQQQEVLTDCIRPQGGKRKRTWSGEYICGQLLQVLCSRHLHPEEPDSLHVVGPFLQRGKNRLNRPQPRWPVDKPGSTESAPPAAAAAEFRKKNIRKFRSRRHNL